MTGGNAKPASATGAGGITPADLARYRAMAAAADDPERVLGPATVAFREMHTLLLAGDRRAADGASLAVQDLCLQACVALAESAEAADDKVRFLAIMIGWAWPRVPAVGAVLDASRAQELARWGLAPEGSG